MGHILRTSAAERLAATRPTHCCYKLNLDNCLLVCSSFIAQLRAQSLYCNNSLDHDHNSVTSPSSPLLLCIWQVFSAAATKGWAWCHHLMQRWRNVRGSLEAQASGREWRLRLYKRHGFFKQTCPIHLLSAVHHILQTSAAERLAATRPTHCC